MNNLAQMIEAARKIGPSVEIQIKASTGKRQMGLVEFYDHWNFVNVTQYGVSRQFTVVGNDFSEVITYLESMANGA